MASLTACSLLSLGSHPGFKLANVQQLSLREGYAEGGLANLSLGCNLSNKVPTGRTFRGRVERVEAREIREAFIEANDEVLRTVRGLRL